MLSREVGMPVCRVPQVRPFLMRILLEIVPKEGNGVKGRQSRLA